ncbi:EAL domain-containing protein [Desulfovibrio sp. OttesenSCG-928-F07]|nr:EAL domain-containing protein [Desulfovibrio sp. OttesenSCG-928-F07]
MNKNFTIDYEQILENLPFVSIRFSYDGTPRKVQAITANIEQLGFKREELLNDSVSWANILHPDDRSTTLEHAQMHIARKINDFRLDYRLVNNLGEVFWVKEYSHINLDEQGNVTSVDTMLLKLSDDGSADNFSQSYISYNFALNEILLNLQEAKLSEALDIILERTGAALNCSYVTLLEDKLEEKRCIVAASWYNTGIEPAFTKKNTSYELDLEKTMPELDSALRRKGMLMANGNNIPPNLKKITDNYNILSIGTFAVYRVGQYFGRLHVADCVLEREWDESTVTFLKSISRLISSILIRLHGEANLLRAQEACETLLDNIDSYIYVVQPETDTLIFANRSFRTAFGADCIGKNTNSFIPLAKEDRIHYENTEAARFNAGWNPDSEYYEVFLEQQKQWLSVCKELAPWVDGQMAYIVNCYDNTPHKLAENEIKRQAYTDYLTGLPNRHHCDASLRALLAETQNIKAPGYLFFIDLDDFKIVNDSFGHDYGDGVLKSFAEFLRETFTGKNQIFRLGGDEFVIIIHHTNGWDVPEYLDALLQRAKQPWKSLDKEFYCSLSIGVVDFIARLEDTNSILKKADIAMYQAKKMGKNNYAYYTEGLNDDTIARSEMEVKLRAAIKNDFAGFEILYQPYYRLEDSAIIGSEALLRMRAENGGYIMPADFMPLAEYLGLIVSMGEFVLRKSAELCKSINDSGFPDFTITINFSAAQFKQKNVVENIARILAATGVKLNNIIISINEGVAINERKMMLSYCEELRALGIRVVMDDFGSGNASFINMRTLPVDRIKLAPMYLYAHEDEFTANFVELVTNLGHVSGKGVCISGIETKEQLEYCRKLGADIVQGFFLHTPTNKDTLLTLINNSKK